MNQNWRKNTSEICIQLKKVMRGDKGKYSLLVRAGGTRHRVDGCGQIRYNGTDPENFERKKRK